MPEGAEIEQSGRVPSVAEAVDGLKLRQRIAERYTTVIGRDRPDLTSGNGEGDGRNNARSENTVARGQGVGTNDLSSSGAIMVRLGQCSFCSAINDYLSF